MLREFQFCCKKLRLLQLSTFNQDPWKNINRLGILRKWITYVKKALYDCLKNQKSLIRERVSYPQG